LQPILASLPKSIASVALSSREDRDRQRDTLLSAIDENRRKAENDSFDLDAITEADLEEPQREKAFYDLERNSRVKRSGRVFGVVAPL
jgi:hypothetical protein